MHVVAEDRCGAVSDACTSLAVPRDRTPPAASVGRNLTIVPLADEWTYNWYDVTQHCALTVTDNCSFDPAITRGIVAITSDDPDEVIEGTPGRFTSGAMLADWAGLMFCLDRSRCPSRTYTVDYAFVDEGGQHTVIQCAFAVRDE